MKSIHARMTSSPHVPTPVPIPLSAQRPAQVVQTVAERVQEIVVPGSDLTVASLVVGARFEEGHLTVLLRPPAGGLSHIRELTGEIRDLLIEMPGVSRVSIEIVLAEH